MGVDWIALSFVQSADNVKELREIVNNKALIMAKIEKPSAVSISTPNIKKETGGLGNRLGNWLNEHF